MSTRPSICVWSEPLNFSKETAQSITVTVSAPPVNLTKAAAVPAHLTQAAVTVHLTKTAVPVPWPKFQRLTLPALALVQALMQVAHTLWRTALALPWHPPSSR